MATSYNSISHHHLTNHLIYLSSSSSFWFSLNSSYDHEFHLSKRLDMSPQDYECLFPMLTGCRTMPFVPVSSLNLPRCSTKNTDRCVSYSLPTDTVMVRGDTEPCPPSSLDSTSALIISSAMSSTRCLIRLRPSPSSFAFVRVVPPTHCCRRRRRCTRGR